MLLTKKAHKLDYKYWLNFCFYDNTIWAPSDTDFSNL